MPASDKVGVVVGKYYRSLPGPFAVAKLVNSAEHSYADPFGCKKVPTSYMFEESVYAALVTHGVGHGLESTT